MSWFKIAGDIFDHNRLSRIDVETLDEILIGRRIRFWAVIRRRDVVDTLKHIRYAETIHNVLRVSHRSIRVNKAPPRQ